MVVLYIIVCIFFQRTFCSCRVPPRVRVLIDPSIRRVVPQVFFNFDIYTPFSRFAASRFAAINPLFPHTWSVHRFYALIFRVHILVGSHRAT